MVAVGCWREGNLSVQLDSALPWLALGLTRGIAAAQAVSFAPNLLIKQGAKLVTCAEDVIEELPTPVRARLTKLEQPAAEQRNLLVAESLTGSGQKIYALLSSDEPRPIDDIVERPGSIPRMFWPHFSIWR